MKLTKHLIGYFDVMGYKSIVKDKEKVSELGRVITDTAGLLIGLSKDLYGFSISPKQYMFSDNFCLCIDLDKIKEQDYRKYLCYFFLIFH
jgi:hypothetical protein